MPDDLTAEAIASAVTALLADPEPRASAELIAQEIAAMPAPQDVVAALV